MGRIAAAGSRNPAWRLFALGSCPDRRRLELENRAEIAQPDRVLARHRRNRMGAAGTLERDRSRSIPRRRARSLPLRAELLQSHGTELAGFSRGFGIVPGHVVP